MGALSFNPYAALAEIQNRRELPAKAANPANIDPEPGQTLAALAGLADVTPQTEKSPAPDRQDPSAWTVALAALDASRSPTGFDPDRWRYLLTDARWLCRYHGPAAAALGWTASDLFGLALPNGIGGLVDRLDGVRNLVLTDRIAHWRGADLEGWLWRESMRPMPTLWEYCRLVRST